MAKPSIHLTLASAALALTVLGCRSDERSSRPDESSSPAATPQTEIDPEASADDIGDEDHADETRDQHTWGAPRERPTAVEPETDPVDPDMPEAVDPGADPKQPPPPSNGGTRG